MGSCSAASFAYIEVGWIGVGCQDHVAGSVDDAIVWLCEAVIKKMVDSCVGGIGGRGLLDTNFAESVKEFVVHCTVTVEEGADNALDSLDACFIESWCRVCVSGVLYLCAICDMCGFVW